MSPSLACSLLSLPHSKQRQVEFLRGLVEAQDAQMSLAADHDLVGTGLHRTAGTLSDGEDPAQPRSFVGRRRRPPQSKWPAADLSSSSSDAEEATPPAPAAAAAPRAKPRVRTAESPRVRFAGSRSRSASPESRRRRKGMGVVIPTACKPAMNYQQPRVLLLAQT